MEVQKKISITEAFKFGFYTAIEHFGFFLALSAAYVGFFILVCMVIWVVTLFLFYLAQSPFNSYNMHIACCPPYYQEFLSTLCSVPIIPTIIGTLCMGLLHRFLSLGYTKISLDFHDHGRSTIGTLFSQKRVLARGYIAGCIYWSGLIIGLFLFIVPGVYWALKYWGYQFLIVDKNIGIFEAFKQSSQLTRGVKWDLFAFGFLCMLINWLAMTFLGIGLFITVPALALADVYVYRSLIKQSSIPSV